jgi:hypothetical protein
VKSLKLSSAILSTFVFLTAVSVPAEAALISLTANINGAQENPPSGSAATGTGIFTLNDVTRTLDLSVTVVGLNPALVTGFHIHRAAIGVNGPIIIDLAALFGLGSLVPSGTGFTFNAVGVTVPVADVANVANTLTYINFHTAANPGGAIRGQLVAAPEPASWMLMAAGVGFLFLRVRKAN